MKRIAVTLLDPATQEPREYWLSTPTPFVLELMAESGVEFARSASTIDVDAVSAAVVLSDKELAAMTPKGRKEAAAERKELLAAKERVSAMTPAEKEEARAARARMVRMEIAGTNAMLAALLTGAEPEGSTGMPSKTWSRKQAADIIPWSEYERVKAVVTELMADTTAGEPEGEAEAVEPTP